MIPASDAFVASPAARANRPVHDGNLTLRCRLVVAGMLLAIACSRDATPETTPAAPADVEPASSAPVAPEPAAPELPPPPAWSPATLAEFEQAVRDQPDDPGALLNLGSMCLQGGDLARARAAFAKGVERHPSDWRFAFNLGLVCLRLDRHAEASEHLQRARDLGASEARVRLLLGRAHHQRAFIGAFSGTLDADALANATRELERAAELAPDDPDVRSALASVREDARDWDGAVTHLREATALAPGDASLVRRLGVAEAKAGHLEGSLAALDRAISMNPADAEAHAQRGTSSLGLGDLPRARASFESAIALNPSLDGAWYGLAQVLRRQGEDAAAARADERFAAASKVARELRTASSRAVSNPEDARAAHDLGVALASSGRQDEARLAYERAIALDPGLDASLNNLAAILLSRGEIALAERHVRAALQAEPGNTAARANLGHVLLQRGRPEEALRELDESARLEPRVASTHVLRGLALLHLRKMTEARDAFRGALARAPDDNVARYYLAGTMAELGDLPEAKKQLREVLAREPGHQAAARELQRLEAASPR